MTPRFAHAVDPIFSYVLDLLDRIHRHEHPSPQEQRLVIRGLLEQAEAILGTGTDWELARYAIISWIDELLVDSPWEGADWWSNNVLEMEQFNTRACFEQFYVRAREASKLPQRDALEVFYVCMMLGFRGLYRDPQLQQSFIEANGLPLELEDWARQTGLSIRLGQGASRACHTRTGPDRGQQTDKPCLSCVVLGCGAADGNCCFGLVLVHQPRLGGDLTDEL